ncbi:hypothetical protein VHEMI04594 [[Torrubiella] hemipterigena]|uniref:Uncharacterized protein n=1 Tax=[Torrubiella] hemipterigena TaxID=1531966 RepID=A0A0A1TGR4_9HYPO|nr:hypothetical protein VHEMI04594 [[Torrubiella] hemipterigena]
MHVPGLTRPGAAELCSDVHQLTPEQNGRTLCLRCDLSSGRIMVSVSPQHGVSAASSQNKRQSPAAPTAAATFSSSASQGDGDSVDVSDKRGAVLDDVRRRMHVTTSRAINHIPGALLLAACLFPGTRRALRLGISALTMHSASLLASLLQHVPGWLVDYSK